MADFVNDNGCFDYDGPLYDYGGTIQCKYCGEEDLHWGAIGDRRKKKYRLLNSKGEIHECPEYSGGVVLKKKIDK